jgi:hypothetical protein
MSNVQDAVQPSLPTSDCVVLKHVAFWTSVPSQSSDPSTVPLPQVALTLGAVHPDVSSSHVAEQARVPSGLAPEVALLQLAYSAGPSHTSVPSSTPSPQTWARHSVVSNLQSGVQETLPHGLALPVAVAQSASQREGDPRTPSTSQSFGGPSHSSPGSWKELPQRAVSSGLRVSSE